MTKTVQQPAQLNALDRFIESEAQKLKLRDQKSGEIKKRIGKLIDEIGGLRKELEKKKAAFEKDREDYFGLLKKHETKIQDEVTKFKDQETRFLDGEMSVDEVQAAKEKSEGLRRDLKADLARELTGVRDLLREKSLAIQRLIFEIASREFSIRQALADNYSLFYDFSKNRLREVEKFMPGRAHLTPLFLQLKEMESDLIISEKGSFPKTVLFKVGSLDELRMLVLDARIQTKDIPAIEAKVEEIKQDGFPFEDYYLNVAYSPGPVGNFREAGFTFSRIPKSPGAQAQEIVTTGEVEDA